MLMYFNLADIDIHYQIERFETMYPPYIYIKAGEDSSTAGNKSSERKVRH